MTKIFFAFFTAPFLALESSISISASTTFSVSQSQSHSLTLSFSIDSQGDYVPPYTNQEYQFNATMQLVEVPFTATAQVKNDCDVISNQPISGSAKVSGVASFASGSITKFIGPAVPVECKAPWTVNINKQIGYPFCEPITTECSTNPLCKRLGFNGTCCEPNNYKPCCAAAGAHASCSGYNSTDYVCPGYTGVFDNCCNVGDFITFECELIQIPNEFNTTGCACINGQCTQSCPKQNRQCNTNTQCSSSTTLLHIRSLFIQVMLLLILILLK